MRVPLLLWHRWRFRSQINWGGGNTASQVQAVTATGSRPGAGPEAAAGAGDASRLAEKAVSDMSKEVGKSAYLIRLAGSARCKVYVCFEGLLGAYLKPEVRERI